MSVIHKNAKDIMTRDVVLVTEDVHINKLNELMLEYSISGIPVVNKNKNLIGIVTKTDVLGASIDAHLDLKVHISLKDILDLHAKDTEIEITAQEELVVKDIMTKNPITVTESTPIESIADKMIINNIHRVIVTNRKKVVGIISTSDLLFYVARKSINE